MRLIQIDIDGTRIDLHPFVSIVRGLQPNLRAQFVAAVEGLASGSTSGLAGLVEAHGVILDLTPETMALLDLGPTMSPAIAPVVRAGDLPFTAIAPEALSRAELGRRRSALASALTAAEEAAARADRLRAASEGALAELTGAAPDEPEHASALDELRTRVTVRGADRMEAERRATEAAAEDGKAAEAHAAAVATVAAVRHRRAELSRAVAMATTALETTRSARDPFAASALEVARQLVADLERELEEGGPNSGAGDESVGFADLDAIDARLADLEARRAPIEVALLGLDSVDPFAVEVALSQVEAGAGGGPGPDHAALALADELAALDSEAGAAAADVDAEELAEARRRLDNARAALAEAERRVRVPELDRDDVRLLEDAHGVVLDAQDKSDGRFGGGRAKSRLDEAREAEQTILDRLGFLTYADFVMGTSILNVDPEREAALDGARDELAAAEDALAALTAGVDAQLAGVEREAKRRHLLDRAAAILGSRPGDDAEFLLRSHRVIGGDMSEKYDRLRDALDVAGVQVYGDFEPVPGPVAVELARVWLDERSHTASTRADLEGDLAEIDRSIAACRQDRQEAEGVAGDSARRARAVARVEEARATLVAAEARVAQNAKAGEEIEELKAELERMTQQEAVAAGEVGEAELAEADASARAHARRVERTKAQADLAAALDRELAAVDELRDVEEQLRGGNMDDARAAREEAAATARIDASAAFAELERARGELAAVDQRLRELPAPDPSEAEEDVVDPDEIEWFLLSRLAAQRKVSYAGSVPLLLDDAFSGLPEGASVHLVERLERMAAAVQVVIVTDDDELATWADAVGVDRAATLLPEAV